MSTVIVLHCPDYSRIPFTVPATSLSLEDVPAHIKQVLTGEAHQITSDLHLQPGVNLKDHLFLVVEENESKNCLRKYHVLALHGSQDGISSYEALHNEALELYASVFNCDLNFDGVKVFKEDGNIVAVNSIASFPCGTFFLLGHQEEADIETTSRPLQEQTTQTKLPPLQSHEARDKTMSSRSVGTNEHVVHELQAREGKEGNIFDAYQPLLGPGEEYKTFIQTKDQVSEHGMGSRRTESEVLPTNKTHGAVVTESKKEKEMSIHELRQVQLLEHACNGFCADQSICQKEHTVPSFIEEVKGMKQKLQDSQKLTSLLQYISLHDASRCPGRSCAIPSCAHKSRGLSSGGLSASDDLSSPQSDSINRHYHQQAVCDTSFDLTRAFNSDTPEDQKEKQYQHHVPSGGATDKASNHHHVFINKDSRLRQTIEQEGINGTDSLVLQGFQNGTGGSKAVQNAANPMQGVPEVEKHGFQRLSVYSGLRRGTCIYSREESFTVGLSYALPEGGKRLGKGGNGRVSVHFVNKKAFAVKKTSYRSKELNSWIQLNHTNVIPLQAVIIDPMEKMCYQFMPIMKGSLKSILSSGNLKQLSQSVSREDWKIIRGNVFHILRKVLEGLSCLEKHNMQHCDVKADNVLIGECSCGKTLDCSCEESAKFKVYLADFDSMKETFLSRKPTTFPPAQFASPNVTTKIMGTPGYRAPELYYALKHPNPMYEKTIMDGRIQAYKEQNCGGPWCDIWSFGVMLARVCLGKPEEFIMDANCLLRNPSASPEVTQANENIHAFVTLYQLIVSTLDDENLKPFARLAKQCLELRYEERPDANQLLNYLDTLTVSSS